MASFNVAGFPAYVYDYQSGAYVLCMIPLGTPVYPVVPMAVSAPTAPLAESTAPLGGHPSSGVEDDHAYVDAETGELLPPEMQAGARDFDETIEALKWVAAENEKEEGELQHVAELLKEEDTAETVEKEKAKELFVEANRKFQIQKSIYKTKGQCEELHVAQVAYIKTVDELRAIVAEINDPAFTLRAMADERWAGENHDDFEQKLKVIYDSIKFKISGFKSKKVGAKPGAAEKRAPKPLTLAEQITVQLAKEAAGGVWGDM